MSAEERRAWNRVIGVGFVFVVGLSCALIAVASGAGLVGAAISGSLGLVVGLGLVWYLSRLSMPTDGGRRRRN